MDARGLLGFNPLEQINCIRSLEVWGNHALQNGHITPASKLLLAGWDAYHIFCQL